MSSVTKVPQSAAGLIPRRRQRSSADEGDKEGARWLRRNRVGHSLVLSMSHNWWSIIPCDPSPRDWPSYLESRQPFRNHPEYYALVNGRRLMSHYGDHMGGQVCTTNPDVIRIFAETAIEHFRKHPDDPMFSISWNDGGVFCQCDRCRALDSQTDAHPLGRLGGRRASARRPLAVQCLPRAPQQRRLGLRV